MKLPYIQLFTGDWRKDPALSMCSPATRGVWIDAICAMHDSDQSGTLSGTADQLARVLRCSPDEFVAAIADLESCNAANIERGCNGVVTLTCRRMKRLKDKAFKAAVRVQKHRGNASVTLSRPSESEDEDVNEVGKGGAGGKPDAAIPTLAEVLVLCQMEACPEDIGRKLFNHYEGNNLWFNQHGRLINVRSKIRDWRDNARQQAHQNGAPTNGKPPVTVFHLKTVMEAKEKQANALRSKYSAEVASGVEWSDPEKRKEYAKLRGEIKDINNQLANMA